MACVVVTWSVLLEVKAGWWMIDNDGSNTDYIDSEAVKSYQGGRCLVCKRMRRRRSKALYKPLHP